MFCAAMSCQACGESFDSPSRSSVSVPRNHMGIQIFCDASCAASADAAVPEAEPDYACDAEVVFTRVRLKGCVRPSASTSRRGLAVRFSRDARDATDARGREFTRLTCGGAQAGVRTGPGDASGSDVFDSRGVADSDEKKQMDVGARRAAVRLEETAGARTDVGADRSASTPARAIGQVSNAQGPDDRGTAITAALTRSQPSPPAAQARGIGTRAFGQARPLSIPRSDFARLFG